MIVYRTYSTPQPFLDQKQDVVVWGIPCLVEENEEQIEVINIYFDSEDNAWKFFNDVNFQFDPLEIGDEDAGGQFDELQTTQT